MANDVQLVKWVFGGSDRGSQSNQVQTTVAADRAKAVPFGGRFQKFHYRYLIWCILILTYVDNLTYWESVEAAILDILFPLKGTRWHLIIWWCLHRHFARVEGYESLWALSHALSITSCAEARSKIRPTICIFFMLAATLALSTSISYVTTDRL